MGDTSDATLPSGVDPRSGFCPETKIFHSLRGTVPLPDPNLPLSVTSYSLSLISPSASHAAFIDASTGASLSFPEFRTQVLTLASSLRALIPQGRVALVISPARIEVPVLYFALLQSGAVVSASNPASSPQEIAHQVSLTRPTVAFATSATARLLPRDLLADVILLDSPRFRSLLRGGDPRPAAPDVLIRQWDTAAVLYSSGTTGMVKAVSLSHRNFIALIAVMAAKRDEEEAAAVQLSGRDGPAVSLFTVPLFHVFGLSFVLRSPALGDTAVLMERFEFPAMLRAVERYRVTFMPVSPPLVVAMVKSDLPTRHDLSSLEVVGCGGAPLGRDVAQRFAERFPNVEIVQGYGLTESTATAAASSTPEENRVYGSAGLLSSNLEARIVDPSTGEALPPGKQGELWLRGPTIMQGYLGNKEATESTLHREGWLKTGDLCYFDDNGFLFIVDRLKELIKYKAYQVAPAELEHILHSHPDIADAAVIPYPDEDAGEIPMAYIVRQPGSTLSEEQVKDFVSKQVAPYKKIRRVSFINEIPKSAAGKIMRRELVKHAVSGNKL